MSETEPIIVFIDSAQESYFSELCTKQEISVYGENLQVACELIRPGSLSFFDALEEISNRITELSDFVIFVVAWEPSILDNNLNLSELLRRLHELTDAIGVKYFKV